MAGRRCVVTGAGSGIGLAVARRLSVEGASVVGLDRVEDPGTLPEPVGFVRCDVRQEASVERAFAEAENALEGVPDVLVNAAGIYRIAPMTDTTLEEWDDVIGTNLTGTFLTGRTFARSLLRSGEPGAVTNVSSIAALAGDAGEPSGHYAASKGGVLALTRQMAVEWAPHGIRANAVCPGVIDTPMLRLTERPEEASAYLETAVPLGRLGSAEEVASVISFLCSPDAAYLTGVAVPVDGGILAL
jgi:NAD(P)-dependent dehydrogenase (short-subunit alcohol dehydrogenase family)